MKEEGKEVEKGASEAAGGGCSHGKKKNKKT